MVQKLGAVLKNGVLGAITTEGLKNFIVEWAATILGCPFGRNVMFLLNVRCKFEVCGFLIKILLSPM